MLIEYKENGCLHVKSFFKKEQILDIFQKMLNLFEIYIGKKIDIENCNKELINFFLQDKQAFIGCANSCQNLLELINLSTSQIMSDKLKELGLKRPIVNTRPLVSFSCSSTAKNENYWKIPAHQDWPSTQGSLNGITCWIPFVDVTNKNGYGPLEVSKKTHMLGLLDFIDNEGVRVLKDSNFSFESIEMEIGDALFFSNFIVHRSGLNIHKDKIRVSAHLRYDDFCERTFLDRKCPKVRIDKNAHFDFPKDFPTSVQVRDAFFNDN